MIRRYIIRSAVSTDCNWIVTENLSSTHTEHQKRQVTHQERKDQVNWRNSCSCTQNNRILQFLLLQILTVIEFVGKLAIGSTNLKCWHAHELLFKDTEATHSQQDVQ